MPKGYRSIIVAIGLILIPLVVAGQSPENLAPNQQIEQQAADSQPAEQPAKESEPAVETVVEGAGAPTEPPAEAYDDSHQRQESDESQENGSQFWWDTAAQWLMAGTGVLALGISAWAVWLVNQTLDETRRATDAAQAAVNVTREMGERQMRAYVGVEFSTAKIDREHRTFAYELRVRNTGQSPAYNIRLGHGFNARPPSERRSFKFSEASGPVVYSNLGPNGALSCAREIRIDNFEEFLEIGKSGDTIVSIHLVGRYFDAFRRRRFFTASYRLNFHAMLAGKERCLEIAERGNRSN